MPFHQPDSLRYYTFESLDEAGVAHAIFTRRGGVSPAPWNSLNLGGTVGDDPGRVIENRRRAFDSLGLPTTSVYDVWQVHSAEVVSTEHPRPPEVPHLKADAILTGKPGVTLFMRFADCVPVFLFDPVRSVSGLVHAGWMGTVKKIVGAAVQAMQQEHHSRPADILAAVGPSIGPDHYSIGPDVAAQVQSAFGRDSELLLQNSAETIQFDLWAANCLILEQSGVRKIEVSGICTACHLEDWLSHRGEHGKTGRFGAVIGSKG
jgi:YfiH family protein